MGDTLFYNGAIYTMNGDYPEAEALLVRDDRILYVGTLSEAEKWLRRMSLDTICGEGCCCRALSTRIAIRRCAPFSHRGYC